MQKDTPQRRGLFVLGVLAPYLVTFSVLPGILIPALRSGSTGGLGTAMLALGILGPACGAFYAWVAAVGDQQPFLTHTELNAVFALLFLVTFVSAPYLTRTYPLVTWKVGLMMAVGGGLALLCWPALFKYLLSYALIVRAAVALTMLLAMRGYGDMHYPLSPPAARALESFWATYLHAVLLPQLVLGSAFTVVPGVLVGLLFIDILRGRGTRF